MRRGRVAGASVAAALVLAVLGGCTLLRGPDYVPTPLPTPDESAHEAAERYLGYLESGDAASAALMIKSVVDHPEKVYAGADLLTNEVYSAAVARIEDATITDERDTSEYSTTVDVQYTLRGEKREGQFMLDSSDGTWWVGTTANGSIFVTLAPPEGDAIPATYEIAGQTVSLAKDGQEGFLLFPGIYSITVDVPDSQVVDPTANPVTREIEIGFDINVTKVTIPVASAP
ncbi:MAG: hypothetical protein JWR04_610 [Rhodoglobus sp.]|nr:hypothetical protein [Rhodoglobus sp.]